MSDLVERLRTTDGRIAYSNEIWELLKEAADEIERLRAVLEEIAGDPTGVSSYQADLAKEALRGNV